MKRKQFPTPPSQEFLSVLKGTICGTSEEHCDGCGRTHLALDGYNFNFDDAAIAYGNDLRKQAEASPDDYVIVPDKDFVEAYRLFGMTFPDNCPCNSLGQYEKFMWEEKDTWKSYLAMRKLTAQNIIDEIGDL